MGQCPKRHIPHCIFIQSGVHPFADPVSSNDNPSDVYISRKLWEWAFADPPERLQILEDPKGLSFTLEFHLSGLLHLSPFARSQGWWCDGVVDLAVDRLERTAFCINGAAWNPGKLTSFQLEYHFLKRRDLVPHRVLFRFAEMDHRHQIQKYPPRRVNTSPESLRNRKWAIDIEIV